jgi:hypothetical protein
VRYKPLTSGFSAKVFFWKVPTEARRWTNSSPKELGNVTHKQSLELRRGANIVRHLHPVSFTCIDVSLQQWHVNCHMSKPSRMFEALSVPKKFANWNQFTFNLFEFTLNWFSSLNVKKSALTNCWGAVFFVIGFIFWSVKLGHKATKI